MTGTEVGLSSGFQIDRIFNFNSFLVNAESIQIDRIFNFNSFVSADRNQNMKEWLSSQHIPFTRNDSGRGLTSLAWKTIVKRT
jgi:hypothetical protein